MANDYRGLLSGFYWSGIEVVHKPTIVTYSFPTTAAPPTYIGALDDPSLTPAAIASYQGFTATEQGLARTALAEWGSSSGLVFIEVAAGKGDINFQKMDFTGTGYQGAGGIGYRPFGDWNYLSYPSFRSDVDAAGDVIMNSALPIAYGTLLHEIGHAIGLKHPTEPVTDYIPYPYVVHQVWSADDPNLTIMSEQSGGTGHLTAIDIQAAQFLYGKDSQNPRYTWDEAAQTLTQYGRVGDDAIRGSSVIDRINGGDGNDKLFGLDGNDALIGGAGQDILDGGAGIDRMAGGTGNDLYFVDDRQDRIVETVDGDYDQVIATISYTLPANVEALQFWGTGVVVGIGNAAANTLYGNNAGNTLSGLSGDDYIDGGSGADLLLGGDGDDRIFAEGANDRISGGAGGDYMEGSSGADRFIFTAMADFGTVTSDIIGDFSHAQHDRIDLRSIDPDAVATGDQAFSFIGIAAFSGSGYEVRYSVAAGGDLLVELSTGGDTVADASFIVRGVSSLVGTDFLL